ncbi:queuosine precursor transporter [Larsenimonas salina]|uniref:queuosine precursor transporter n=1 Tax=Larsenimonas salina TaxID=1295565 RepID=UPI002072B025|nr:queuosine precursor transporter [Larsenimonas salina]MCM5703379.1 queuosine precursor transporter [Larsenimonas salina]
MVFGRHSTTPLEARLVLAHLTIICISNILVQYPLTLFGWHTTWGAFSFPLIFVLTDLTVRLVGQSSARNVVFMAMLPALALSYLASLMLNHEGPLFSLNTLLDPIGARVALASFGAYVAGQLCDVICFARLRKRGYGAGAPVLSTIFGNLLDTFTFFAIAFYASSNTFMAAHWVEIAWVDYLIKLTASAFIFLPLYGLGVSVLKRRISTYTVSLSSH